MQLILQPIKSKDGSKRWKIFFSEQLFFLTKGEQGLLQQLNALANFKGVDMSRTWAVIPCYLYHHY